MLRVKHFLVFYGLCLLSVILYLKHYAWFCSWHFSDSKTRFLLIGDPQIQGDSRVDNYGFYGQVDVWYNDLYFRHITDTLLFFLSPSHVFVLGDLFSSQYISDSEFEHRVQRYRWINQNVKVPFYNIVGNHDIGYGSDIDEDNLERFINAFGKVDDIIIIEDHLIGIVNSMNLDPSSYEEAHDNAWNNLYKLKEEKEKTGKPVLLMKHIPLHKDDFNFSGPHFSNLFINQRKMERCVERAASAKDWRGNFKWQNMMSENTTEYILNEIKPKFIFNGHDHDGCIYRHNSDTVEYTVRSIMGDYHGYVGLFEILPFSKDDGSTDYDYFYTPCSFVHLSVVTITAILSLVWCGLVLCYCICIKRVKKTKVM